MTFERIYDITLTLGGDVPVYPGDRPYSREVRSSIEDGSQSNVSVLAMSAHSGTHLDAPRHFIEGAKTLDEFPAERFVVPAHVVNVDDGKCVRAEHLDGVDIERGDAVLFRTRNSTSGSISSGVFSEDYVYVSPEAAEACMARGVSLVGLDYLTLDDYHIDGSPTHLALLGNDVLILETINLHDVPTGRYTLACLPLKMKGCEASPVRAVLMK